jgi:hypothetical protein
VGNAGTVIMTYEVRVGFLRWAFPDTCDSLFAPRLFGSFPLRRTPAHVITASRRRMALTQSPSSVLLVACDDLMSAWSAIAS